MAPKTVCLFLFGMLHAEHAAADSDEAMKTGKAMSKFMHAGNMPRPATQYTGAPLVSNRISGASIPMIAQSDLSIHSAMLETLANMEARSNELRAEYQRLQARIQKMPQADDRASSGSVASFGWLAGLMASIGLAASVSVAAVRKYSRPGLTLGHASTRSRTSTVQMSESALESRPNPVLGVASLGMGLIKPIFKVEAKLQAAVLSLGSEDVREQARAQIEADKNSAPVVVYTYGLSPFSGACKAFLDELGCKYNDIELGKEWFLLGPKASAMRAELAATTGQSSLPHVFIKGQSVGGLYSGNDQGEGLSALQKSGELVKKLKDARAL